MIEQFSMFDGLSAEQRADIERFSVRKRYRKNTVLIEHGDEANNLYLLEQGQVRIYRAGNDDKQVILNQIESGGYFGELGLLGANTRVASALAITDCTVLVLTKNSFLKLLSAHPGIAVTLMHDMVKHIQVLADEVASLALSDVYGRVAKLLSDSASDEEGRLITPRFTHQDVADRVGSSREMVSRILRDLIEGQYLSKDGKRYIIEKKLPPRW